MCLLGAGRNDDRDATEALPAMLDVLWAGSPSQGTDVGLQTPMSNAEEWPNCEAWSPKPAHSPGQVGSRPFCRHSGAGKGSVGDVPLGHMWRWCSEGSAQGDVRAKCEKGPFPTRKRPPWQVGAQRCTRLQFLAAFQLEMSITLMV